MKRVACLAIIFSACTPPLDTTRQPGDDSSFGEIAYSLSCQRLAYGEDLASGGDTVDVAGNTYREVCHYGDGMPDEAYAAVRALDAQRHGLIPALDTAFAAADLDKLQETLTTEDFLAMYDDGTAEKAVDRLAALLSLMSKDNELAPALSRLENRPGYRPLPAASGALGATAAYPQLDMFLAAVPPALAPGGAVHDDFVKLQAVLAKELAEAQVLAAGRDGADRTLNIAANLLLGESALLGTGHPRLLVRRDARGLAIVERDGAAWPTPFVDRNGDGLADADADGRFVDAAGKAMAVAPPFATAAADPAGTRRDADGRVLNDHGKPLYRYVDLDKTLLAGVARDAPQLFDPAQGTALDLLRGAAAVFGKRVMLTRSYPDNSTLAYKSFDTQDASFLDIFYGYLNLLADPRVDDNLALVRALTVDHQPQAAQLLEAMLAAADLGKDFPEANLAAGAALYDDLIPVVDQILATPGLAEDLLRALEDPKVKQLAKRFRDLMTYKDSIDYNPDTQALVGQLRTPVDRSKSDDGFNRSVFQRILHLIADSDGWQLCNKEGALLTFFGIPASLPYAECDLLQIDDLAVFYVQSIAYAKDASGRVLLDDQGRPLPKANLPLKLPSWEAPLITDGIMESQSTIIGFRHHPTPEALNRVLFLDPSPDFIAATMDPPVCKDGDRYIDQHSGSLAAFELNGFYDQLRPIVQVFADHDAEKLFVKTLVVLHQHWPSRTSAQHQHTNPNGHAYAKMSDVKSYEPLIAAIVDKSGLWEALTDGAPVIDRINLASGKNAVDVLTAAARWVFTPQPGLKDRLGRSTTTTEDGRTVPVLSPWHVLADAYKAKHAQIAAAGGDGKLWQDAGGRVLDVLARADKVNGSWQFRNPRFRGVSVALLDFITGRLQAHRSAGDLDAWLHRDLIARTADLLTSPALDAAIDFVGAFDRAPAARKGLEALLSWLNTDGSAGFDGNLEMGADLLQWFADDPDLVPVVHLAGKALDPALGLVDAQLSFVARARQADGNQAVSTLVRKLESNASMGRTAISLIVDAICEVHRIHPFTDLGKPMTAADYQQVWKNVAAYLNDEKRGLKKFIAIVANRHIP